MASPPCEKYRKLFLLLSGYMFMCKEAETSKILIMPVDYGFNSRVMNMAKIGDILQEDGHDVSFMTNNILLKVFRPETLRIVEYDIPSDVKVRTIADPRTVEEMVAMMASTFGGLQMVPFFESFILPYCEVIARNKALLRRLKKDAYDLMIVDNLNECGRIVLDYLDIPGIVYSNFGFYTQPDILYPVLTSFMCDPFLYVCETDQLSFFQRTLNLIVVGIHGNYLLPGLRDKLHAVRMKHGINASVSIHDSYKNSLVLINAHFALDYPRPLMPNVVTISGLYHKDPKPLPAEISEVINNSPYDAIVVVSFGTLVPDIGERISEIMAVVFAKLPATVFWRFTGKQPKGLGNNTHLVGWFPQADVLAHPKTRLFVTHCGISSVFEAAYNSVPVVAIPLFVDQNYNAAKLVWRAKLGVRVDINKLNVANFEEAVFEAFTNPIYQENAKRLSDIVTDQEMKPKDKILYWVNYVIRHKGVPHLVSSESYNLGVLRFYSVDVIAFLFLLTSTVVALFLLVACFLFRRCIVADKKRKEE